MLIVYRYNMFVAAGTLAVQHKTYQIQELIGA